MPLLSRAWLTGIRGNRYTMKNVYRVGAIQPTIVGLRSYSTSTEDTDVQAAGIDHKTIEKSFDPQAFNSRLTTVEKGLACLVVTVTNLGSKVDGGFKRLDNWMKFLLGIFVTTIVVKFAYADRELKKDIKGDLKLEVIALKSEILLELSRMELRLSGNIGKAGAKDEAKK